MKLQHVILNLFTLLAIAGSVLQSSPSEAIERLKISFEPEAETIPANTLRMYFMFDRPARGLVHQSEVKLVGPDGSEIKNAFMDFGQELWSPEGKRLTVFFDPGKIKRDVEAEGDAVSPLKEGKSYQIKLADYAHSFQVSPPVRERLNPKIWKVIEPSSSSSQLEIKFDRVIDLPADFRTIDKLRDWLPIRREQCAKRVFRKSRWLRSSGRRIAIRCRRWPSGTGSVSRRSIRGASASVAFGRAMFGACGNSKLRMRG
jgi:hypothetical protein